MAQQFNFFMSPDDERELFQKLANWELDLYPEFTEPGRKPGKVVPEAAATLTEPGYYFAVGDVEGYPIKRGQNKGRWKIDELRSPVVYFCRSQMEDEELRSGYFWCELEMSGDYSRTGGKPDKLRRLTLELQTFLRVRYRRSQPTGFAIGPHAARMSQAGTPLREAGRKGELFLPYR
ncbi:MAG: hypothetical protein JST92_21710 [Deltaproteobacteria bacterium]|nr:hypothetical protein [Deltaproteobacteria bacterium]